MSKVEMRVGCNNVNGSSEGRSVKCKICGSKQAKSRSKGLMIISKLEGCGVGWS